MSTIPNTMEDIYALANKIRLLDECELADVDVGAFEPMARDDEERPLKTNKVYTEAELAAYLDRVDRAKGVG